MSGPREFRLVPVRECPYWNTGPWSDLGQETLGYWKANIASAQAYDGRFENAAVILFDDAGLLVGHVPLARGGESWVFTDGSEFLPMARALEAAAVILCHNHPEGSSATPSEQDIRSGRVLAFQAKVWKLKLLDSVVIGDDGACSLAANGLLPDLEAELGPDAEPADYLDARDSWMVSAALMFRDRELQSLVIDKAHKCGLSEKDFVLQFIRGLLKAHVSAAPGADPKLAFASSSIYGKDSKQLLRALVDEAMERGLDTWACFWEMGREGGLERLKARLAAKAAGERDLKMEPAGGAAGVSALT